MTTYLNVSVMPEKGSRPRVSVGPNAIAALYLLGREAQSVHVQFDAGTREQATEAAEYFESLAAEATATAKWCRERAGE